MNYKICHLTSVHKEGDSRIFHKECKSLVKAGIDVNLVVTGAVDKQVDGVKIFGIEEVEGNRLIRMTKTVNKVFEKALEVNADIYHLHDPELLLIAGKLKRNGKKVIYDSHEDLPRQILEKRYIPSFARKLISIFIEILENKKVAKIDGVITATENINNRFLKINKNSVNISNYPIIEEFDFYDNWDEKENAVCYIGGIFETRGILELLKSIENTDIKIHLAGIYSPKNLREKLVKLEGWKNVIEWGFVGREKINEILKLSKAGIVTLHPTESYKVSLPIKMFEYMASGIPVIASDFPLWKSIIIDAKSGVCVNPADINAIKNAIVELLHNDEKSKEMGKNGRKAVEEKYSWDREAEKLVNFYRKLL